MEKSKIKNPSPAGRQEKSKIAIQSLKLFLIPLFLLGGCATVKEGAKGVLGVSTKALEDSRKEAMSKTFNCDYNTCFSRAQEILKDMRTYIYARDTKKNLIAVYASEQDTTPVGIFFKVIDATNTKIEVSSPSTYAKESIAQRFFSSLEESLSQKK